MVVVVVVFIVYDMVKLVDWGMIVICVCLFEKLGGKFGDWLC